VKFGVSLIMRGSGATPEAFLAVARHAEALGYDSLWASDHFFFPKLTQSYPNTPHGGIPPAWSEGYWECFTVLNQVAACTQRIKIGSSVLVFPMRHPIETAKQVSSLDRFCNGRFIFGVGVGWLKDEFEALNWPFAERGARMNEGLEICTKLWTVERPSHAGRFYRFEDAIFGPKPLQKPHPPIWIAGHAPAALRRAARFGDTWHPFKPSHASLARYKSELLRYLEERGRKPDSIGIAPKVAVAFQDRAPQPGQDPTEGRPQDILDAVRRYRDLGATEMVLDYKPETVDQARVMMDRFANEVRGKV